jgi:hypothetical protein
MCGVPRIFTQRLILHLIFVSYERKVLEMKNWTNAFRELLGNQTQSLDMQQYDYCSDEWKSAHDKKTMTNYLLTVVIFLAGLWAVWEGSLFMAVLLLALAANFNHQSSNHILVSEIMGSQRLLAMLINRQSQEIKALRIQLGSQDKLSNVEHQETQL